MFFFVCPSAKVSGKTCGIHKYNLLQVFNNYENVNSGLLTEVAEIFQTTVAPKAGDP